MDSRTIRFRSTAKWNEIPLVDIAIGPDSYPVERRGRAKGSLP